ncbi:peptidase M19 renal dipeptidase [Deinococcus maricopensis DSM 21211]|uniref:Peptidase M19 renal dipeptidase n=2 Tax=Deinococcus TaxID=1298 RepID=E8U8W5_DEIML|nr:peptidase M19 renal dipeptidase [Deinococcus maricopensis DSM 21211]
MNAALGRDLTLPLAELRDLEGPVGDQEALVTFPALRSAGVAACFATLFAWPASSGMPGGYETAQEARRMALAQLDQYARWEEAGLVRVLRTADDARAHFARWSAERDVASPLGVVLLMEGADPVRDPNEVEFWAREGVRVIGPAWGRTRYAGGTDAPGPLTDAGVDLLHAMREARVALDAAHLDDASFWGAVDLHPTVICTHANARAFVRTNRQLTEDMAARVAASGGVIGLVPFGKFLREGWTSAQPRVPVSDLVRVAAHFAGVVGWAHVALGTDFDGGFGRPTLPRGIDSHADLGAFLEGVPDEFREGVASGHWRAWMEAHL